MATRVKPTNPKLRRGRETSQIAGAWAFSHWSTAVRDHVAGNALTPTGAATIALGFDGPAASIAGGNGNFFQTAANIFDPSTTDFSFAVWFQIAAFGAVRGILSNGSGTGNTWLRAAGTAVLQCGIGGTFKPGSTTLVANAVYCAVGSFSAANRVVYLNGQPEITGMTAAASVSAPLQVGGIAGASGLNGLISQVVLWTRALSQAEALRISTQPYRMWTPRKRWAMTSVQSAATKKVRRTLYLRSGSRGVA